MIRIENLGKRFQRKHGAVDAICDLSMTVEDGDFISVTGPSGSGKSTLLLMMGGMTSPTTGRVLWNQASIFDMSPAKRAMWRESAVGFVFQAFNLIPYLNVHDNVGMALSLSGRMPAGYDGRIRSLLERVGLIDRQDHLPNELSVGQQQRAALARALVKNPQIILADEPTGNLDRETAKEVLSILKSLNEEGRTIVLITHDPDIARMAKRSVRIVEGRISNP